MTFASLLAFNLALFAAILSPGPALLVAIRTTLGAGRRAGLAVGLGLATMASIWTLLALLGLDVVFDLFPWAYGAAKVVGAIYLLYVAFRVWAAADAAIADSRLATTRAFRDGFLINLFNPKSVLFAAAVLIVVFPGDMSLLENTVVVLNHLLVELLFYSLLAAGMSTPLVSRKYLDAKRYLDRIAAVVLGGLGIRLLMSRTDT